LILVPLIDLKLVQELQIGGTGSGKIAGRESLLKNKRKRALSNSGELESAPKSREKRQ
jgi:hypothetical protein